MPGTEVRRVLLTLLAVLPIVGASRWLQGQALAIRDRWPPVDETAFVPDPRLARLLAIGYNEVAADLAWTRLLVYYGEGMLVGGKLRDVTPQLAFITNLDPYFYKPYEWGAYAVTYKEKAATRREFEESIEILERGVKYHPARWDLWWILGIRYAYDLAEADPDNAVKWRERGAVALERALRLPGAPDTLALQLISMRTKLGQHDRALKELQEMILLTEEGPARDKLLARYEAMLEAPGAGRALEEAANQFRAQWQADMPYAPEALHVILGPRREPIRRLADLAEWEQVELDDVEVEADEPDASAAPPP